MSLDVFLNKERAVRMAVFTSNITHNLGPMADAAGIYKHLWRPEEVGITKAGELIEPLEKGFSLLLAQPERFKAMNPSNGWGKYEDLVLFVRDYIAACREDPDADVEVCR